MNNVIIVCEYGWIICGKSAYTTYSKNDFNSTTVKLTEAYVVRCWKNGRGIGGLAKKEYKNTYTLDEIGAVEINQNKILFEIPCEW